MTIDNGDLEKLLDNIKRDTVMSAEGKQCKGVLFNASQLARGGEMLLEALENRGCIQIEDTGVQGVPNEFAHKGKYGQGMIRIIYIKDLPVTIGYSGEDITKLLEPGDIIQLGKNCNAPGQLATIEQVKP